MKSTQKYIAAKDGPHGVLGIAYARKRRNRG